MKSLSVTVYLLLCDWFAQILCTFCRKYKRFVDIYYTIVVR